MQIRKDSSQLNMFFVNYLICMALLLIPQVGKANITSDVAKYSLWQKGLAPYHKPNTVVEYEKELWGTTVISGVVDPELTVYKAKGKNSGAAVLILAGGGYTVQAIYHEGFVSDNSVRRKTYELVNIISTALTYR